MRAFILAMLASLAAFADATPVRIADQPVQVTGTFTSSGQGNTNGSPTTFSGNNICATVWLAGQPGAAFNLSAGTVATTFTPSFSADATQSGNNCTGGTWTTTNFLDPVTGNSSASLVTTNPNSAALLNVKLGTSVCARVCTAGSGTSGTASGFMLATVATATPAPSADVTDRAGRILGQLTDGTSAITPTKTGQLPTALDGTGGVKVHEQGTVPISAVSLPLPTNAAQDATLTGGTAKTIARGGAKGSTSAADVTSTAQGTNNQALDVDLFFSGSAVDPRTRSWNLTSGSDSVDVGDRAGRLLGIVYGSQGVQLKQTATNNNLQAEIAVGGTLIDPRSIRALTSSDVVSAAISGTWNVGLTSGSNTIGAVTAPGAAALALDASVTGLEVSQGSTTSGQKGVLKLGAVTTAAPTYTTGQSSPVSLQVDGSQRVAVTNTPAVTISSGTVTTTPPSNASTNIAQVNGVTTQTGAGTAGTGTQRVAAATSDGAVLATANTGRLQVDVISGGGSNASVGATGSAVPASATLVGGSKSGNTAAFLLDASGNLNVNVAAGGGSGGTSSSFGSAFPATGTAIGAKDSSGTNLAALNLDASGFLKVNVAAGGGAGGTSSSFGAASPATGTAAGGFATTAAPSYTTGNMGALSLTTAGGLREDLTTVAGTATDTNSGAKSAGTLRVVLATDQPALTNKLLVTPDSVALPANQSTNESQINGVTPLMGNGVSGTGSQRVNIASDNTAFAVNATTTGAAASGAAKSGNPVQQGLVFNTTQPTVTTGQVVEAQATARGGQIVATGADTFNVTVTSAPTTAVTIASLPALTTGSATIGAVTGPAAAPLALDATLTGGSLKAKVTGNAGAAMDAAGQNATSPANELLIAGQFNTSPTTITSGNVSPLQLDSAGNVKVNIAAGASSGAVAQGSTTSGQTGSLIQAAVTTSAPTYTNGQTSPLNMDTSGNLRMVWSGTGTLQGSGTAGSPAGGVLTVQPPSSGSTTFPISGSLTPTDTPGSLVSLSAACSTGVSCAANSTALVQMAGQGGANVTFSSGSSPTMTIVADCATDGGTAWSLTGSPSTSGLVDFVAPGGVKSNTVVGPGNVSYQLVPQAGCLGTTIRVRAVNTGGTVNAQVRATLLAQPGYAGAVGANSYPAQAVALMAQDSSTATTSVAVKANANGLLVAQGSAANLNATVIGGVSNDTSAIAAGAETLPAVSRASGTATTAGRAEKLQVSSAAGGLFVEGPVANGTTAAGNPVGVAGIARATGAAPTQVTAGQSSALTTDLEHRLWVAAEHPNGFTCTVDAASASTQCVGLSGASLSYYIKSVTISGSAAITMKVNSSTTAGNACATSPALVIPTMYLGANTGGSLQFPQGIKVTANSALCCQPSGASGSCVINGYIAP